MFDATAQQQLVSLHMENPQSFSLEGADNSKNYSFIHSSNPSGHEQEEAPHAQHQPLDEILESLGFGIWYSDLPFNRLEWNNTCKRHFGLPPEAEVTIDLFY